MQLVLEEEEETLPGDICGHIFVPFVLIAGKDPIHKQMSSKPEEPEEQEPEAYPASYVDLVVVLDCQAKPYDEVA